MFDIARSLYAVSGRRGAAPQYAFLNRILAVGSGEIRASGPVHVIEEIL